MRRNVLPPTKQHPRIRAELTARGLSIADLARCSGLNYYTLSRTLTGLARPSETLRQRVALALGMREADLWSETPARGGAHA